MAATWQTCQERETVLLPARANGETGRPCRFGRAVGSACSSWSMLDWVSALVRLPVLLSFVLLAPLALRSLYSPDSLQMAAREDNFPRDLMAKNRRYQTAGSWLYPYGQARIRRADIRSC